jgi:hypothetical protein
MAGADIGEQLTGTPSDGGFIGQSGQVQRYRGFLNIRGVFKPDHRRTDLAGPQGSPQDGGQMRVNHW